MKLAKWGNSLAVRIPASVTQALDLKAGDGIEVHIVGDREFTIARKPSRAAIVHRLRKFQALLPADFVFDRDNANAR